MSVTWREIKLTTLQKMFAADGNNIPSDAATRDYVASMPGAANEGLQLLATAGKFIIKQINIAHNPIPNLIAGGEHIYSVIRGETEFQTDGARSFYFEVFARGELTYTITVGDEVISTEALSPNFGYEEVRGLISNADDANVKVTFESDYPYAIKNIALYAADFVSANDVPTYAEKVRYNLKEMVNDFYALATEDLYYEGDADVTRYIRTSDYFQEANKVLVLDRDTPGNFRVYYKAYPQKITQYTSDDEELAIDDEVAPLLCLYMASQLYKDDDNSIATIYRNEFEVGFERLQKTVKTPSAERFTSESGWI